MGLLAALPKAALPHCGKQTITVRSTVSVYKRTLLNRDLIVRHIDSLEEEIKSSFVSFVTSTKHISINTVSVNRSLEIRYVTPFVCSRWSRQHGTHPHSSRPSPSLSTLPRRLSSSLAPSLHFRATPSFSTSSSAPTSSPFPTTPRSAPLHLPHKFTHTHAHKHKHMLVQTNIQPPRTPALPKIAVAPVLAALRPLCWLLPPYRSPPPSLRPPPRPARRRRSARPQRWRWSKPRVLR